MGETTEIAASAFAGGDASRAVRAALFERVIERIHRYFVKVVWDADAVDDCVQRTLLLLERSFQEGSYDPRRSFNRWMWIKAHSVYVDHCRERGRRMEPLPDEEQVADSGAAGGAARVGRAPGAEQAAIDARLDAEAILARLRESLGAEAFEAFVLFYDEGHTVTDIAAILGRDRKTVRKWIDVGERQAVRLLG